MSWVNGSRDKLDLNGPSLAEVAAMEAKAEAMAVKVAVPVSGHREWLRGFRPYTPPARVLAERREMRKPLLEEQAAWLETVPRNRHERRKRLAILAEIQEKLDRIPA